MDEQQQPNMLVQFQASVLNGQTDEIRAFIEALAQEASNNYLLALAHEYTFQTFCEPDFHDGKRIMLARDLARLCYGTDEIMTLSQLCRRHGFPFLTLPEAAKQNTLKLELLRHFSLSKFASHQRFATWEHVLIATANGETAFARKVWSFIQANIMYAFADLESRRQTGKGVPENVATQQGVIETEGDALVRMAMAYRDQQKQLEAHRKELDDQQRAMIQAQQDIIQLQRSELETKEHMLLAIQSMQWVTIRQYVQISKLQRQMPDPIQQRYALWLTTYCFDNQLAMYKAATADRQWPNEKTYCVTAIQQTLPGWLTRYGNEAQGTLGDLSA